MALSNVVDVQITRQAASITRVGFGTLAFVYDALTAPTARVLQFGSPTEIEASSVLTASAKAALTAMFTGQLVPGIVKAIYRLVGQVDPEDNESYVEALTAAINVDQDWYSLAIQSRSASDILSVAAWTEARTKLFIAATADVDVLDPLADDDIASQLLANLYSRTALIYAPTAATSWPDTSWAGGLLPNDPGSITWSFKPVRGVPGSVFTASQIAALEAKRVTRIETIAGLSQTIGGVTSEPGAYIDLIRGVDWLKQSMAEDIFAELVRSPKIPYTNAGIAIIRTAIMARLQLAIQRSVLVDDENLAVFAPDVLDTLPDDRANRILRDVSFTARLAGAIHRVIVRGTVSV